MTAKPEFEVSIPNLDAIKDAFRRYPAIAEPIYQRALSATQAVFAQNTHRLNPVPYKTGNLLQSFRYRILRLQASWGPTAKYAPFVEYGTAPHAIMPKTKPFLAWPSGGTSGQYVESKSGKRYYKSGAAGSYHFSRRGVWHPGTKPNPFMGAIAEKSEPRIMELFGEAGDLVLQEIGRQGA